MSASSSYQIKTTMIQSYSLVWSCQMMFTVSEGEEDVGEEERGMSIFPSVDRLSETTRHLVLLKEFAYIQPSPFSVRLFHDLHHGVGCEELSFTIIGRLSATQSADYKLCKWKVIHYTGNNQQYLNPEVSRDSDIYQVRGEKTTKTRLYLYLIALSK